MTKVPDDFVRKEKRQAEDDIEAAYRATMLEFGGEENVPICGACQRSPEAAGSYVRRLKEIVRRQAERIGRLRRECHLLAELVEDLEFEEERRAQGCQEEIGG